MVKDCQAESILLGLTSVLSGGRQVLIQKTEAMIWSVHLLWDHLDRDTVKRIKQDVFYGVFELISNKLTVSQQTSHWPLQCSIVKTQKQLRRSHFSVNKPETIAESWDALYRDITRRTLIFHISSGLLTPVNNSSTGNNRRDERSSSFAYVFHIAYMYFSTDQRNESKTLHCNGKILIGNAVNIN